MARSPLTLAASVTAALPRVGVVRVGALTEGTSGRFDSAVADLDDGRRVVVRVATSAEAADELANEVRVLRALTPGIRGLVPFRAPEVIGEASLGSDRVAVFDLLPGFKVDAAHVPPGPGVATALGRAIARVHDLPTSIVRDAGLPARTPEQCRDDAERLLDRAEATGRLPFALLRRWSAALAVDALWRFESTVTLGGVESSAFLFSDDGETISVTGLLDWHGLSVGDPSSDLRWIASAPTAADDIVAAYAARANRAPDAHLRDRARLYAELEFAKWLVHGHTSGATTVADDAAALLEALAANVEGQPLIAPAGADVEDAIALLDRVPESAGDAVDTSMQTDAYHPGMLDVFGEDDEAPADGETAPLEVSSWSGLGPAEDEEPRRTNFADLEFRDADGTTGSTNAGTDDGIDEESHRDDAARNAMRRWASS